MAADTIPLRQEIQIMFDEFKRGKPIWAEFSGHERQDPDVVVFIAEQHSMQHGMMLRGSVHVSGIAIADRGLQAIAEALKVLGDRAMGQKLPLVSVRDPAPMLALGTSEGTEIFAQPRSGVS